MYTKQELDLVGTYEADTVRDEDLLNMAKYMYKAGCRLVSIGVESGSQFILDKIGKNITINDVRDTVKAFKKAKIRIYNTLNGKRKRRDDIESAKQNRKRGKYSL